MAADELGLDKIEIRRKNFLTPDMFPYTTPVGLVYDTGNYQATLDKMIELGDLAGFEARAAASKAKGKLRGLGLSTWIEACGIAPSNLVGVLGARVGLFRCGHGSGQCNGVDQRHDWCAQPWAGA